MNHFPVLLQRNLHDLACAVRQPGLCVRALCEAVAVLLSKNMTCARPRCNATSRKHFPHTSHCTLHTSHLSSFHLVSCLPICQLCSSWLFSCHLSAAQTFSCVGAPLPFVTTSRRHHVPESPLPFVTTSRRHHFPSSPLPFVTTALSHHFPKSPHSLRHHFPKVTTLPSSPLPFVTTSLRHHFPSSPLPFVTTSLRHHTPKVTTLPSSPHSQSHHTPFLTTSLRHHFP